MEWLDKGRYRTDTTEFAALKLLHRYTANWTAVGGADAVCWCCDGCCPWPSIAVSACAPLNSILLGLSAAYSTGLQDVTCHALPPTCHRYLLAPSRAFSCFSVFTSPAVNLQSIVISVYVCLSVCPLAYVKNHTYKYHQIFYTCYLWPRLGPALTAV